MPFWCYNVFGNANRGHKLFMGDAGQLDAGLRDQLPDHPPVRVERLVPGSVESLSGDRLLHGVGTVVGRYPCSPAPSS